MWQGTDENHQVRDQDVIDTSDEHYLKQTKARIDTSARVWQYAITQAEQIVRSSTHNIGILDLAQRILDESRRER